MAMAEEQAAEIGRDRQQEDQQRLAGAKAVQGSTPARSTRANERTLLEASLVNATSEAHERQLALFDAEIKRRQQIRAIQDNRALGPDDRRRDPVRQRGHRARAHPDSDADRARRGGRKRTSRSRSR